MSKASRACLFVLTIAVVVSFYVESAHAQCVGGASGTPQTPSYLLSNEFQDGRAAGSITPGCMRDFIASSYPSTREYTVAPFGAPWGADYYCTATDCSTALSAALTATKNTVAGAIGGKVKLARGLYPFTSQVAVCDLNSVVIEGDSSMGMFGSGGTILSQNANVSVIKLCFTSTAATSVTIRGIEFLNNASATAACIYSESAINIDISFNQFDGCNPAITAEGPWDWFINKNNFHNCGTDSTTHSCVVLAASTHSFGGFGVGYGCAGVDISHNRFEERIGAGIFSSDTSAVFQCADLRIAFNKFEGILTQAKPILTGDYAWARIIGNGCYIADTTCIDGDAKSYNNLIEANTFISAAGTAINWCGYGSLITGNTFYNNTGANITICTTGGGNAGFANKVGGNSAFPGESNGMLSNGGSGTITTY